LGYLGTALLLTIPKISSYDMEHEEFIDLAGFDDFIENITKYMNRILE